MLFVYNPSASEWNNTILVSQLFAAGKLSKYPLWFIKIIEDLDVFNYNCKCDLYGQWSTIDRKVFGQIYHFFVLQVAAIFYPDLPITIATQYNWFLATFNLLYPFLLFIALCNIAIVFRLNIKESMAFIIQLSQFVGNAFSLLFSVTWPFQILQVIFEINDMNRLYLYFLFFSNLFALWTQLLSVSLLVDRLLCIWKPLFYKNNATRKRALLLSFILLLLSLFFSSLNLYSDLKLDMQTTSLINSSAYFVICIVFVLSLIVQSVLLICFLCVLQRRTIQLSSQLKKRQRNLNRIMICCGITETVLSIFHIVNKFAWGVVFLMNYFQVSDIKSVMFFTQLAISTSDMSTAFVGCAPFASMIICMMLSQMYRQAIGSFFCCPNAGHNSIGPTSVARSLTKPVTHT